MEGLLRVLATMAATATVVAAAVLTRTAASWWRDPGRFEPERLRPRVRQLHWRLAGVVAVALALGVAGWYLARWAEVAALMFVALALARASNGLSVRALRRCQWEADRRARTAPPPPPPPPVA